MRWCKMELGSFVAVGIAREKDKSQDAGSGLERRLDLVGWGHKLHLTPGAMLHKAANGKGCLGDTAVDTVAGEDPAAIVDIAESEQTLV